MGGPKQPLFLAIPDQPQKKHPVLKSPIGYGPLYRRSLGAISGYQVDI